MTASVKATRSASPIVIIALIAVACIFARMAYLVIIVGDEYSTQAQETRTVTIKTTPKRGTIYDRNGVVLAASVDATTIYCNPTEVDNVQEASKLIASVLGGVATDYVSCLTTNGTTFSYIKRQGDVELAKKLKEVKSENPEVLKGVYFLSDSRREYPNGQVAGQIVGICDVDGNGICGLELQYDDILKGSSGVYVAERSEAGTEIPGSVKENIAAKSGEDIMVTLDVSMQMQVEQILAEQTQKVGRLGCAVLMDSTNGEIYAMCSYPYLNPAKPQESESGSDNVICVTQNLEPGSMMKTVTALGILQAGKMTPESTVACPAALQADEYYITDSWERGGLTMSLDTILTKSSNVGISLASDSIGAQGIYDNLVKSRILEKTGIDFPGEASGSVTDPSTWSNIQRYNITFGQGIRVTPLEMVKFYASIENDGVATTPHLLMVKTQNGTRPTYETQDLGYSETALSDLKSMLHNVVQNNESNKAGIDGFDVCGKTSTAEYTENGEYVKGKYNVGFCGFLNGASMPFTCYVGMTESEATVTTTQVFHDIMKTAVDRYGITTRK